MTMVPEVPEVPQVPGPPDPRGPGHAVRSAAWFAALVAGSVVLGLLGGILWGECAPRALLEEVGAGTAEVTNAETRAFFGADVWFSGVAAAAGLLAGLLGYRLAVAPRTGPARAAAALALILGAVAGGLAMMWLGGQIGLAGYRHHLASSANGTRFYASLALGSKSALAFWPLLTAVVLLIAEWGARPAPAARPVPE